MADRARERVRRVIGPGVVVEVKQVRTIYVTWALSADPVPTTACLICMGVYSPTSTLHREQADERRPARMRVGIAERTFAPK